MRFQHFNRGRYAGTFILEQTAIPLKELVADFLLPSHS
jgi:hypothetical protein